MSSAPPMTCAARITGCRAKEKQRPVKGGPPERDKQSRQEGVIAMRLTDLLELLEPGTRVWIATGSIWSTTWRRSWWPRMRWTSCGCLL